MLPGFFDFRTLTPLGHGGICLVSVLVPFLGNLGLGRPLRPRPPLARQPGRDAADARGGRVALAAVGVAIALG